MAEGLDQLLDSLLYEGYALYPYTPGATKNATPTPFGIVYPTVYAAESNTTFDHARLEGAAVLEGDSPTLSVELLYLAPSGERHQAIPRRVTLGPLRVEERRTVGFQEGRLTLRSSIEKDDRVHVRACVHNTLVVTPGLDRRAALARSLISTQIVVRITSGRFISPLDAGLNSVNTFPVLASDADDVLLGTTIMLPDHPRLAPESLGSLFDATEIEEALLLHVQALSDDERAEIALQDPAVQEMVTRAETATPEQILALHGRVTMRDPREGEDSARVGDAVFRRGGKVVLHPPPEADLHARMADGRRATLERILIDYDGRTHLGVTIDGDPGQQLMRETGRFLYFFAEEVEVVEP